MKISSLKVLNLNEHAKKNTLATLIQVLLKSINIFRLNFWQIGIIVIIVSMVSHLAIYPVTEYLTAFAKNPEALKEAKFLPIIFTALTILLNQTMFVIAITLVVLSRPQNIFQCFERIRAFVKNKFITLYLACTLKSILINIGLTLYFFPGIIVVVAFSMVEFIILIEGKGIKESIYKSIEMVRPLFFKLVVCISLFYFILFIVLGLPIYFKSVIYFGLIALYIINMLVLYLRLKE
ncbi:hypothetical protein [Candidatus Jidaibacter acanthamoebae]|nr:hypothetical protein [Candidatus Jidaibacter acanthamoeba]